MLEREWCWCAVKKSTTAQTLGKYTSIILTPSSVTDENYMAHWGKKQQNKTWAGEIDKWLGTPMAGLKWREVKQLSLGWREWRWKACVKTKNTANVCETSATHLTLVHLICYVLIVITSHGYENASYLCALAGRPFNSYPFGSKFSLALFANWLN